jgi:hypothetical protein
MVLLGTLYNGRLKAWTIHLPPHVSTSSHAIMKKWKMHDLRRYEARYIYNSRRVALNAAYLLAAGKSPLHNGRHVAVIPPLELSGPMGVPWLWSSPVRMTHERSIRVREHERETREFVQSIGLSPCTAQRALHHIKQSLTEQKKVDLRSTRWGGHLLKSRA